MSNKMAWKTEDAQKTATDAPTSPDPLTYRALLGEMKIGFNAAKSDVESGVNPHVASANMDVTVANDAEELIKFLKRIETTARSSSIRVNRRRYLSTVSTLVGNLTHHLGMIEGYRATPGVDAEEL